jgi:ribosomal protein L11 methyltransferase
MVGNRIMVSSLQPKELFAYECEGSGPPLGEPDDRSFLGVWSEHPFYYVFFEQEASPGFYNWLEKQGTWLLRGRYRLAYDQWQQTSAETITVGPFLIEMVRGDAAATEGGNAMVIRLDPGVVFGSGLHGSTMGCMLALAHLHEQFAINQAVDMGTGTGILAVSCAKLGAVRVLAIDKKLLAIRTAQRNILLNGLEQRVNIVAAESLAVLKAPSELLIMNLEWTALQRFLATSEWLSYRWVILSGFLERQWDELKRYIPSAFHLSHQVTIDGWLTLTISTDHKPSSDAAI